MGNITKRKRKRGFEWHEKSSVPEDLDTLEEEESENSLRAIPFKNVVGGRNGR